VHVRGWLIPVTIITSTGPLAAQVEARPGERVRVFASSGTSEGILVALDTAAIRIAPRSGEERAIPLGTVARLEVRRGRRPAIGTGAGIGLGVGAVLGGALALATADTHCEPGVDAGCLDAGTQVLAGAGVGALAGAAVGAVIGAGVGRDVWTQAGLGRPRLSLVPRRNGIRIGVSMSF
jgi:hypothetical protein